MGARAASLVSYGSQKPAQPARVMVNLTTTSSTSAGARGSHPGHRPSPSRDPSPSPVPSRRRPSRHGQGHRPSRRDPSHHGPGRRDPSRRRDRPNRGPVRRHDPSPRRGRSRRGRRRRDHRDHRGHRRHPIRRHPRGGSGGQGRRAARMSQSSYRERTGPPGRRPRQQAHHRTATLRSVRRRPLHRRPNAGPIAVKSSSRGSFPTPLTTTVRYPEMAEQIVLNSLYDAVNFVIMFLVALASRQCMWF